MEYEWFIWIYTKILHFTINTDACFLFLFLSFNAYVFDATINIDT